MWKEQKSDTQAVMQVCHCPDHFLASVIYYRIDTQQQGIYLFYVIKNKNVHGLIYASVLQLDHIKKESIKMQE